MFTGGIYDDDGVQYLTQRIPYRYRVLSDTLIHIVREGETLWSIAGQYYASFERPSGLWWIIADFQPDPIFDPTLKLAAGASLFIPSLRTITELIFAESRRDESTYD
jgi:hypothetical protein